MPAPLRAPEVRGRRSRPSGTPGVSMEVGKQAFDVIAAMLADELISKSIEQDPSRLSAESWVFLINAELQREKYGVAVKAPAGPTTPLQESPIFYNEVMPRGTGIRPYGTTMAEMTIRCLGELIDVAHSRERQGIADQQWAKLLASTLDVLKQSGLRSGEIKNAEALKRDVLRKTLPEQFDQLASDLALLDLATSGLAAFDSAEAKSASGRVVRTIADHPDVVVQFLRNDSVVIQIESPSSAESLVRLVNKSAISKKALPVEVRDFVDAQAGRMLENITSGIISHGWETSLLLAIDQAKSVEEHQGSGTPRPAGPGDAAAVDTLATLIRAADPSQRTLMALSPELSEPLEGLARRFPPVNNALQAVAPSLSTGVEKHFL